MGKGILGWALPVLLAAVFSTGAAAQSTGDEIRTLESNIQSGLEKHGERTIGQNILHWKTRLESLSQCSAVLSVREETMMGDRIVRQQQVSISLSRVTWISLDERKHWITVPCQSPERCVTTASTCTKTTKEGITVDCSSPGVKQEGEFRLQWDGAEEAGRLMERDLRRAVQLCRAPAFTAGTFR